MKSLRVTPKEITELEDNEIFVFGSNESGHHGAGAARLAVDKFGAVWGKPEGLYGQTYAIPTKAKNYRYTLELDEIKVYVDNFIQFASENPELTFLVTEIGCGLAGLSTEDVGPLFKECAELENVALPTLFWLEVLALEE